MHGTYNKAASQDVTDNTATRLLALCADQIRAAIDEAFCEVESLSRAVLDTARRADALTIAEHNQAGNGA